MLLNNGEAITGNITRAGELFYVAVEGGEIRVKADDVERFCGSLDEGYRQKRAAIGPRDATGHLRLAEWCLRHDLLGNAGRELADAMQIDPSHPAIGPVERRLRMIVEPLPPPLVPVARPERSDISQEELDQMVDSLPPEAVETFTRAVQPLLMNHCGSAECHGPAPRSEFQLLRGPAGQPPSRATTQRNLRAVLSQVDRANPAASPLLARPIQPHGTAEKAIFSEINREQYQQIVEWADMLPPEAGPMGPGLNAPRETAVTLVAGANPAVEAASSTTQNPTPPQGPFNDGAQHTIGTPEGGEHTIQRGARLPAFVPADPFDAEIFNRRQFGPVDH